MRPITLSVSAACIVAIAATLLITPARIAGAQVIEEILALRFTTLSHSVNHVADTPLAAAFADAKWQPVS